MLALAAYNGGLTNVDDWVAQANAAGHALSAEAIPFPETREYVQPGARRPARIPRHLRAPARHPVAAAGPRLSRLRAAPGALAERLL